MEESSCRFIEVTTTMMEESSYSFIEVTTTMEVIAYSMSWAWKSCGGASILLSPNNQFLIKM